MVPAVLQSKKDYYIIEVRKGGKVSGEYFTPSDAELKAMMTASSTLKPLSPSETEEQMARRVFRRALPAAAQTICDIAENSLNDRTRLQAATYIVERNLGKVGDDMAHASGDTLRGLVEGIEQDLKDGKFKD